MAIQSRARSTRRSGDLAQQQPAAPSGRKAAAGAAQEAPPQHTTSQTPLLHQPPHPLHPYPHPASPPASDDYDEQDSRPTKKRKLSIRSKSTQTTLDHHFLPSQSHPPKPTTSQVSVTQTRPPPPLQPLNGVRKPVHIDDGELASGVATLKSNKRPKTPLQGSRETPGKQEEKRTLRSQDEGPRLKSDLAIYFPNYEDIVFDAPKEEELINFDTVLYITDDAAKQVKSEQQLSPTAKSGKAIKGSASSARNGTLTNGSTSASTSTPQRSNSTHLNGSPSLNLDTISRTIPANPPDPLTDDYYLKSHNRAERKEKQLRNIEKERAMHEKVQLDRLLDGLQGHDWLKVLGITGITDGEARKYEEKRDYFIAEVQALVDKFRAWKEQEKKQRLDKEAAQAAREEEEEEEEEEDDDDEEADDSDAADSTAPPSSDLNASAARQLQQETASALKSSKHLPRLKLSLKPASSSTSTPRTAHAPPPPPRLSPEVPITSFYAKRHLRDAALGKARHGRNVLAFGQPVPEMEEREFELPEEYVTADVVRANAREKRRRRREGLGEGGAGG